MYIDKTQTPDDGQLCICKVPGFNVTGLAIALFSNGSFLSYDLAKPKKQKKSDNAQEEKKSEPDFIILDTHVTEYMKLNQDGSIHFEEKVKDDILNEQISESVKPQLDNEFNLSVLRHLNELDGLYVKRFHYIAMEDVEGLFYKFLHEEMTFEQFQETFSENFLSKEDFEALQNNSDLLDELQVDHLNGFFCTVTLPTVRQFLPNGEFILDDISDTNTIEKHFYNDSFTDLFSSIEDAYKEHIESQR